MRNDPLVAAVILAGAATGCMGSVPRLSPAVAGCYEVVPSQWSAAHVRVTGLTRLPALIALDTISLGRVITPTAWRRDHRGTARLSLESLPWSWSGDELVFDRYSSPHPLANTSDDLPILSMT